MPVAPSMRAFRKASRELLELRRAAGDLTGAIEAAERWAEREPSDDEAQHRLIETLAAAGERAEAIRQYETYARRMAADGLQPLDETAALAEWIGCHVAVLFFRFCCSGFVVPLCLVSSGLRAQLGKCSRCCILFILSILSGSLQWL